MGLTRDGVWLHVSSFSGDGVSGGVVNLIVEEVDALHEELVGRGVRIDTGPVDQTWGNREMYVKDADGNSIRFIRPSSGQPSAVGECVPRSHGLDTQECLSYLVRDLFLSM
jgi:hypothetical protein